MPAWSVRRSKRNKPKCHAQWVVIRERQNSITKIILQRQEMHPQSQHLHDSRRWRAAPPFQYLLMVRQSHVTRKSLKERRRLRSLGRSQCLCETPHQSNVRFRLAFAFTSRRRCRCWSWNIWGAGSEDGASNSTMFSEGLEIKEGCPTSKILSLAWSSCVASGCTCVASASADWLVNLLHKGQHRAHRHRTT